jgi:hypothetical protein
MYGYHKDWFKRDYNIVMIDDFEYKKGKYYTSNYTDDQLYKSYMQIHNYFTKGEEIE